jgi:hypothetical protein
LAVQLLIGYSIGFVLTIEAIVLRNCGWARPQLRCQIVSRESVRRNAASFKRPNRRSAGGVAGRRRSRGNSSARRVAHTKRILYTPGPALERYGRFKAGAHGAGEYDCPVIKPCAGWGEAAPFRASSGCSLLVVTGLSAPLWRTSATRRISLRLENVETPGKGGASAPPFQTRREKPGLAA